MSPQWRRPVNKAMILCNACGIYYSRHNTLPRRRKVWNVDEAQWTCSTTTTSALYL
jgi:hypothetical protein